MTGDGGQVTGDNSVPWHRAATEGTARTFIRDICVIPFGSAQGLSLSNGCGQEFCGLRIVADQERFGPILTHSPWILSSFDVSRALELRNFGVHAG